MKGNLTKGTSFSRKEIANPPPIYSNRQIETLKFQNYMKMTWIAFYTFVVSFFLCLLCFILDAFYFQTGLFTQIVLASLGGVLGFGFKRIFSFLFPDNKRTQ